ncbi:hypothetical protein R6Q57_012763 [Mikania cordata]
MAPTRKRTGAKGAKNTQLRLGDLVLAKVKGFPAWPAKISKPEDWKRTPDPRKYFVQFFGTEEIAFVAPVDIQPFTSESKDKLLIRCKGKTVKYFTQAVKEICDTFEESENKSSNSLKDDNDGQASQPDANVIQMDDDVMITDGHNCATSSNEIVIRGLGLERCSRIHRELGYEDVNLGVSPFVNDHSLSFSTIKQAEFCSDYRTSPKMETTSTSCAGHNTNSKIGSYVETNGQRSKKIAKASKNNHDDVVIKKNHSPAFQTSHITSSVIMNSMDGTRRSSSHVRKNEAALDVANPEYGDGIGKTKKILKDKTPIGLTDDLSKDVEDTGNTLLKDNGVLHPAKKSKFSDEVPKKSQILRKNYVSRKGGNEEVKRAKLNLKTKNHLVLEGQTDVSGYGSGVLGDESVAQPTKRRRLALEDKPEDSKSESSFTPIKGEHTDSVKSGPQVHMKKRTVRIFDDDEDEPKTPVHGRSSKVVDKGSHTLMFAEKVAVVTEDIQDSPGMSENMNVKESVPKTQQDISEVVEEKSFHIAGKSESEKKSSVEIPKGFVSPVKSPFDAYNKEMETSKVNKTLGKVSGNISQKKGPSTSFKLSSGVYDAGHHSQNNAINERIGPVIAGERHTTTPKSSSRVIETAAVLRKPNDSSLLSSERSEFRVVKTTSLSDSRNADSNKSMRHLIAVAQAKRNQAQSHNLVHRNSPDSVSAAQQTTVGHEIMTQTHDQIDSTEFEERRTSSGHLPAGGSLSGGTEAAVARDAFEGMIETLSRTKESIGRATRHAIDCAKHGIANEVVELLTRKLESESSFHRRVDLFFLVDSITQCSHSQKGIAGASYIPTVQAALPRLLGAVAPPGANARENRRQCLKVLKLWLERKILPDTLLQNYIEAIGSSNNGASAVISSKRQPRSERAVDDPIREMEGMFVDEYGSNAMFQLPGLFSSNVFEEDDEDDILNFSHKEGVCKSTLELNTATGELETCSVTSNERRHCILEDVDGELEMEDVSRHPKGELFLMAGGFCKTAQEDEGSNRTLDTTSNNSSEVSPFREGSPPLPPGSPPPTPPLPSSPPPPLSPPMVPLPPSAPSPPPPPPIPPSQTYPPHVDPPQMLFSHPSMLPIPSNVPLNSCLGTHVDSAVSAEMFLQQPSSFLPAIPTSAYEPLGFSSRTVEYGQQIYTNPLGSHSNQQYKTGNLLLPPRTFQTPVLNQTDTGQIQYPNPVMMQHSYPPLYGLTKPTDGPRRYGGDEKWKPPLNEFNNDSQRGAWMSNGQTSLSTTPSFVQEGYFRQRMERPPTNKMTFQPMGQNIVPAGAPNPGRSGSLMMPFRNSWRPT